MKTSVTYSQIFKLALPILGGLIANQLIIVADTYFLGKQSELYQTAAGQGGLLYTVFFLMGYALTIASQIIISRRIGENKITEVGKIFQNTLQIGLIYSICVSIFLYFFSDKILYYFLQSDAIAYNASIYLKYRAFGFIGVQIAWTFAAYNIGRGKSLAVSVASVAAATTNIFLDWVLIFGKFGFSELNIEGAAIASAIADCSGAIVYIIFALINTESKKYHIFKLEFLKLEYFSVILKLGTPLVIQHSLSITSWYFFFVWIENTGEKNIAVSIILRAVYSVLLMLPISLGSSCNSIVSNLLGQDKKGEVIATSYKIAISSMLLCIIYLTLVYFFSQDILMAFSSSSETISLGLNSFYTILLGTFLFSFSYVLFQTISGTGNTNMALIVEVVCIAIYLIFTYYACNKENISLSFIWLAEPLYMFLMGVFSIIYLHSGHWKRKVI